MDSDRLTSVTASELAGLIAGGEVSPVEVVEAYLERIDRYNAKLNAFITVTRDQALRAARDAEQAVARGDRLGPLHGLPLAVKDQFETKDILTTAGSRVLSDYVPDHDATVIARARDAGAILIGKLNMTQFAAGGGDRYPYGEARNPWDPEHTPGLSSSGSGIAIAASLCAIALGEDTAGSVRMPASCNGIVGLRPTWGLVSRYGMLPFSWSYDTAGPMTRTVEDTALVMNAIVGHDANDALTSRRPVPDYTRLLNGDLKGVRIGLLQELTDSGATNGEVLQAVQDAARQMESLGATVQEVSLPILAQMGAAVAVVAESDGAYVHRKWIGTQPNNYGHNTRRRLLAGSLIPGHVLQKAMRIREVMRRDWLGLFERFDILLSPTMPTPPGKIEYVEGVATREEAERRFGHARSTTFPAALAGTPALSVPCGFASTGLPIGLQLMGDRFQDGLVLKVGYAYQQSTDWHLQRPTL